MGRSASSPLVEDVWTRGGRYNSRLNRLRVNEFDMGSSIALRWSMT